MHAKLKTKSTQSLGGSTPTGQNEGCRGPPFPRRVKLNQAGSAAARQLAVKMYYLPEATRMATRARVEWESIRPNYGPVCRRRVSDSLVFDGRSACAA